MKKITRVAGIALCLALIMMGSCSLVEPYREMSPSSLEDSGGTAPETPEEAIAFVKEFLGIAVGEEIAGLSPAEDPNDIEGALKAYLLSKIPEPKTTTMETFSFSVDLGYKGPAGDSGTADVKGGMEGTLPYDWLFSELAAENEYSLRGLKIKLLFSGEMTQLNLGTYDLVQAKLKNDGEFSSDMDFTTDSDDPPAPNPDTVKGLLAIKLKMSNGFSVKNKNTGEGVKFTITANNDVSKKWEDILGDESALKAFMEKITFTINVFNDADTPLGAEELSLYDLMPTT